MKKNNMMSSCPSKDTKLKNKIIYLTVIKRKQLRVIKFHNNNK